MIRSVFAIASDLQACIDRLHEAGFRPEEISLIAAQDDSAFEDQATGTGVAWLPAVGSVLACGPLQLLLQGGQGLIRRLAELGVPAYAALRYEDALARGAAVVAVHTDNGFEIETLTALLRDGGCEQVASA